MRDFIKISPLGTIRVLGVPFGVSKSEVIDIIFEKYKFRIQEIKKMGFLYYNKKQSALNMFFYTNSDPNLEMREEDWRFDNFIVQKKKLSEKECDKCFNYFQTIFGDFFVKEQTEKQIHLFNALYSVGIIKELEESGYNCTLGIKRKYTGSQNGSIDKIYGVEDINTAYKNRYDECKKLNENKRIISLIKNKTFYKYILKAVLSVLLLVIAYLFVLNDRYYLSDSCHRCFDKWTKQLYILGSRGGYYQPINE